VKLKEDYESALCEICGRRLGECAVWRMGIGFTLCIGLYAQSSFAMGQYRGGRGGDL
jgi:hypothetical protein